MINKTYHNFQFSTLNLSNFQLSTLNLSNSQLKQLST